MTFELSYGDQRALVVRRGAALLGYAVGGRDVIDACAPTEVPPAFDSAVLAPWPNRLRDGRWLLDGVPQQVAINEPERGTALHGLVMWADWSPDRVSDDEVLLSCLVHAQPGYPFDLRLTVRYALSDDGLSCEMTATNVGNGAAPFGCSVHPFIGGPETAVDAMTLRLPARSRVVVDERLLPVELCAVAGTEHDFTATRSLAGVQLDTAYGDCEPARQGRRSVVVGLGDVDVSLWADEQFGWWQIYTADAFPAEHPRHRRSVAVEPMTCPPDAFNSGTDLVWLAAGESWSGSWGLVVTP